MEEIKRRTHVVTAYLQGEWSAIYLASTIESACLQIRKILELIALGSLVANRAIYSQQHEKFHEYWNAERILRDLEGINPDFYPKPLEPEDGVAPDGVTRSWVHLKSGFLTKKEFVKVYKKCGGVMHADNPLGSKRSLDYYQSEIPKWIEKIMNLLNRHIMILKGDDNRYVVHMQESDGRVKAYTFGKVEGEVQQGS